MKLYATITSERATKGQGGNQFINIDLLIGEAKNPIDAGRVSMKPKATTFAWTLYLAHSLLTVFVNPTMPAFAEA